MVRWRRTARVWRLTARNGIRVRRPPRASRLANRDDAARRARRNSSRSARREDVARELGEMKGAMMKFGQLLSFIVEALPDDAQKALATLQSDATPMAPALAAKMVTRRARTTARADLPRLAACADRRGERRPGAPRRHPRRPRRRGEGAVPGRGRGDRQRPRQRRGLLPPRHRVRAEGARRQGPRRRAARPDARGARLRARSGATRPSSATTSPAIRSSRIPAVDPATSTDGC